MDENRTIQMEFIPRYWVISAAMRFKQGLINNLTTPKSYVVPIQIKGDDPRLCNSCSRG